LCIVVVLWLREFDKSLKFASSSSSGEKVMHLSRDHWSCRCAYIIFTIYGYWEFLQTDLRTWFCGLINLHAIRTVYSYLQLHYNKSCKCIQYNWRPTWGTTKWRPTWDIVVSLMAPNAYSLYSVKLNVIISCNRKYKYYFLIH